MEVGDGEVSHGITVKSSFLMDLGSAVAERLPGSYGPLCFQLIYDPALGELGSESVSVTDLNARFGGGYPLCHAAGGNFVEWLILEAEGKPLPGSAGEWTDGVVIDRRDGNLKIMRKGFAQAGAGAAARP